MPESYDVNSIVRYLSDLGFNITEVSDEALTVGVNIGGDSHLLKGCFGVNFPLAIPCFYLLNRTAYGRLAHVGWRLNVKRGSDDLGLFCNGVSISRSLNFEEPGKVFQYGLESSISLLTESLSSSESNDEQVLAEFSGHWGFSCLDRKGADISMIEPERAVRPLRVLTQDGSTRIYSLPDVPVNNSYPVPSGRWTKELGQKGIYVPLSKPVFPPSPGEDILDWWKNQVLSHLEPDVLESLKAQIQKSTAKVKQYSVVLSVPTPVDGHYAWVGFDLFNRVKSAPPLREGSSVIGWEVTPFKLQIHNQEYLLSRGGASPQQSKGRLLIVGCGSLGGEIARLLGHSGIGHLDLIDYDSFETNNIYRHVLPSTYLGQEKTKALAENLKCKFPYLEVEVDEDHVDLQALTNDENLEQILSKYDGVIVATGDATQERYFNDVLARMKRRPWVIYSWLEGHGIGGHAVYVHTESTGCLSCLYRDAINGVPSLENIQNFMSVNQSFTVDLSGCGTHFLPYGYVDVVQTAVLTVRMVSKALQGDFYDSQRDSWKGSSDDADRAELELKRRYYNFDSSLGPVALRWDDCPVCAVGL